MGLADRLGLTRTSQFIATVELHELLQVPLVQGKFRIKWKFKGSSTNHFGSDLIDGDESLVSTASGSGSNNRKGPLGSIVTSRPRGVSADSSNKDSTAEESSGGGTTTTTGTSRRVSNEYNHHQRSLSNSRSIPSSPFPDLRTPNPNRTPTTSTNGGFNFNSFASNPASPHISSRNGSPDIKDRLKMYNESEGGGAPLHHLLSVSRASELPDLPPSPIVYTPRIAEPKGSTNLVPLRSHTATFNREVNCVVSIPLRALATSTSSKFVLQPCPMRLSIRQEVIGTHGQKEEIKTGEVVLDLTQFVGKSTGDTPTARRYLLRDSKTNATLRATVKMEWIGGESRFIAPPLRSGQVKESTTTSSIISTPTSNRSSTSLSSRKVSGLSTRDGGITMTSNSSLKTASTASLHSTGSSVPVRSSSPARSRGWHPSSSNFVAPIGIGESGIIERNTHDIIDTLFNRPRNQSKSNDVSKGLITNSTSEAQVESIAGTNNNSSNSTSMGNRRPNSIQSSPAKGKEREGSWFKIPQNSCSSASSSPLKPPPPPPNLSPTSTTIPSLTPLKLQLPYIPSNINSNTNSRPTSIKSNSNSISMRRNSSHSIHILPPELSTNSRKFSSTSIQSRSVRWGDDDPDPDDLDIDNKKNVIGNGAENRLGIRITTLTKESGGEIIDCGRKGGKGEEEEEESKEEAEVKSAVRGSFVLA